MSRRPVARIGFDGPGVGGRCTEGVRVETRRPGDIQSGILAPSRQHGEHPSSPCLLSRSGRCRRGRTAGLWAGRAACRGGVWQGCGRDGLCRRRRTAGLWAGRTACRQGVYRTAVPTERTGPATAYAGLCRPGAEGPRPLPASTPRLQRPRHQPPTHHAPFPCPPPTPATAVPFRPRARPASSSENRSTGRPCASDLRSPVRLRRCRRAARRDGIEAPHINSCPNH